MQKAELILVKLNQKSKSNKTFKFKRLYRNLYNPDFHLYGYSKIYTREGNMTQGADGRTIDGFNMKWITETIIQLRDERYYPTPVRRVFIPKKNGTNSYRKSLEKFSKRFTNRFSQKTHMGSGQTEAAIQHYSKSNEPVQEPHGQLKETYRVSLIQ